MEISERNLRLSDHRLNFFIALTKYLNVLNNFVECKNKTNHLQFYSDFS